MMGWILSKGARASSVSSLLTGVALATVGCGAGAAAEVVRPVDQTYAGAAGDKAAPAVCRDVEAEGTPLIVDWKPEDRAELEAAMRQGVAVVHYDCDGVKLLPDCKVEGEYKYIGTTRQEQVLELDNADKAKANLPLSGGSIGAGLERGSSLDIGLVMVGKKTANAFKVDKGLLKNRCEGATHFVRGAIVGAFAMKTRTSGQVGAAAELFGVGASAESSSKKGVSNKQGDIQACNQADSESEKAPKDCGAPLRLSLLALGHEVDAKAPPKDVACPKGTIAVKGVCEAPSKDTPHECKGDDIDDCVKQCDAGNVTSCGKMYLDALLKSLEDPRYDKVSVHMLQKGCEQRDFYLCSALGEVTRDGTFGLTKDPRKGAELFGKACKGGYGAGCTNLGRMVPADKMTAQLFSRACNANDAAGCMLFADQLANGTGVTANPASAKDAYRRACSLGSYSLNKKDRQKACDKAK